MWSVVEAFSGLALVEGTEQRGQHLASLIKKDQNEECKCLLCMVNPILALIQL